MHPTVWNCDNVTKPMENTDFGFGCHPGARENTIQTMFLISFDPGATRVQRSGRNPGAIRVHSGCADSKFIKHVSKTTGFRCILIRVQPGCNPGAHFQNMLNTYVALMICLFSQ